MSVASGIVTPEAVVLEFETAGVGSRLVARVIDTAIQGVLLTVLLLGTVFIGSLIGKIGLAGVFISIFVVLFVYPIAFETLWRGRTPGKAALGLRVVTVEGAPIRFRHAAIRAFLALIDVYLLTGSIGVVAMLLSARSQRLGDLVAGTVVLRERTGAGQPRAVDFAVPPGYEPYAGSLDVSGLSDADYEAVRAFLMRAGSLEPTRRYELARQLATPLLSRLRHTPPTWVGPEALLACVAAVYQARSRRVPVPAGEYAGMAPPTPGLFSAPAAAPAPPAGVPPTVPPSPSIPPVPAPPPAPGDGFVPPP